MYKLFYCTSCECNEVFESDSYQAIMCEMFKRTNEEHCPESYSDYDEHNLAWYSVQEWFDDEDLDPEFISQSPKFWL